MSSKKIKVTPDSKAVFHPLEKEKTQPEGSKAWGGVFTESTDRRVELFTESISYDRRLFEADIRASIAHAEMLLSIGILTVGELAKMKEGLLEIRREIEENRFVFNIEFEDIHLHIEHALIAKIGDPGRKLHTARSRNDQVVTDMRLWIRDALDRVDRRLLDVQSAFVTRCDADFEVILPGYTHTRRAQPVLAPHIWLAYCEKFERDRQRIKDCRKRVNVAGLGAAALAGTSIPIDRFKTAELLDFTGVAANSLDVSSDRDFILESAFCLTQIALHLSTLAEEWILWSTAEFNFLRLPQSFCTGSSIMPQKINPDVLELIRGKTARVAGNLQSLIVLTKGLPLAYNRDLQEDKEPIFDSFDTVETSLTLAAPLVAGTTLNQNVIADRLDKGYLDATTLMEYLIMKGVPQRTAHGIVGKLVRSAMEKEVPLTKLSLKEFHEFYEGFDYNVFSVLGAKNAVEAMKSYASTAPEQVRMQIDHWKQKIEREVLDGTETADSEN
ncbi:MAG: argininosuccinate lyase [Planctomycetaceae bacterium]|jgi:argininosuccinate lyase|nr:argininosuccinate lyase [Planctomycetaceae bacterium]